MTPLPTITGQVLTHKSIVQYTDLVASTPLSWIDILMLGIPANHMILAVKVTVLTNFVMGTNNKLMVYIGNSNVFPVPLSNLDSELLVSNTDNCYGMAMITVPSGSDSSYEYGSFRWFTLSSPGTATFEQNALIGYPSFPGAKCLPQRFDAHDITARFVMLGSGNSVVTPQSTPGLLLSLGTDGVVEIAVQYCAI